MNITIDTLKKEDYYCGFLQLLEQLTKVESDLITYNEFSEQFDNMQSHVFVIKNNDIIIGTASVIIEPKFIHRLSNVGHIEDVVIDNSYRGNGFGKKLISHCINYCKDNGCYKVILNCNTNNIPFYEKCGLTTKNVEMSMYL